jgi:TonB family protein
VPIRTEPASESAGPRADDGPRPAAPAAEVRGQAAPSMAPAAPPVIGAETARALRVYDSFPMVLAQSAASAADVVVEVCVSDHGQVSDAVIARGGHGAIGDTLRTAIRSWRYRPLVVNGAATPFCHFMRIQYAMN